MPTVDLSTIRLGKMMRIVVCGPLDPRKLLWDIVADLFPEPNEDADCTSLLVFISQPKFRGGHAVADSESHMSARVSVQFEQ